MRRFFNILVGLVLLAAIVGGLAWFVYQSITEAPGVVAAVVTGLLAILGLGVQRYLEQEREDARVRRERLSPIYENIVKHLHESDTTPKMQRRLVQSFRELAQGVLLRGTPRVVKAFAGWKALVDSAPDSPLTLVGLEHVLFAMREDLGVSNDGLGRGDLLRLFVNDVDPLLAVLDEEDTQGGPGSSRP